MNDTINSDLEDLIHPCPRCRAEVGEPCHGVPEDGAEWEEFNGEDESHVERNQSVPKPN